ncbi:thioredoxin-dependent thiol peroxidase [Alienimonas californiensis]|uniref:thioredoxin-dependent peroxiredoxin n=1 Tax=Alienimonas californiensis TaxID=2527989 RepID=A0A517PDT2_9PLAN|nr:thioredoxin-dependent thiol peroxidase [Alienimonas californiensis]QDT17491.1 Putative peroxiredoxin bcp [Alienimonas californiensis]
MPDETAPAPVAPPAVGDAAPDATLVATPGNEPLTLSEVWADGPVVLYFYPKDATPGCTTEACDFRDRDAALAEARATVLGVSPDPPASHEKFIAKQELPFRLLSDEDKAVATAYGVWVEKSMYGRKYMGVQRATFLIAEGGTIAAAWPKVKVKGHADAVLAALADLPSA